MNEREDSGNLCTSGSSSGPAVYIPPHLRGGGNNNIVEPEKDYRNSGGRDNRDFNNRDYRNDNRGYVKL